MAYKPYSMPTEQNRIVSVTNSGTDANGNHIWVPGGTYTIVWKLHYWGHYINPIKGGGAVPSIEWFTYWLYPYPYYSQGAGYPRSSFEDEFERVLFNTLSTAAAYNYLYMDIKYPETPSDNQQWLNYQAYPPHHLATIEEHSASSSMSADNGGTQWSGLGDGATWKDSYETYTVTTTVEVDNDIPSGTHALTYIGHRHPIIARGGTDFYFGPGEELVRDIVPIVVEGGTTNYGDWPPPRDPGGDGDYDGDQVWEPPPSDEDDDSTNGTWTDVGSLATTGGGSYNQQIIAVGNSEIYFSEIPEGTAGTANYSIGSIVQAGDGSSNIFTDSKHGDLTDVFTIGTTFDIVGSDFNDRSYTVTLSAPSVETPITTTLIVSPKVVDEDPVTGLIKNIVTA